MFKSGIILLCVLSLALAIPIVPQPRLLRSNQELNEDGTFNWGYELDDGTKVEQNGYLKNRGTEQEGIFFRGAYSYPDPDGKLINVRYTADADGGFKPEGEHLPQPPPIPEAIQKALAIIYKNAEEQKLRNRNQPVRNQGRA